MEDKLTTTFLQLFCEKNSDGTKSLRLKGKELDQRYGDRLESTDMLAVSEFLCESPKVVDLDLCYNNIGDKGIFILQSSYLKTDKNNMRHLNLGACSLTWRALEYFCLIAESLKLKSLRLFGNKLGPDGGRLVGLLLEKNQTIEHIDLGDTDQTMSSVLYITSALRSDYGKNTSVKVLDMSRIIPSNPYYQLDPGELAGQLGNMLKMNATLYELHVQKCEFDGHDIERLLDGMKYNRTLAMLDLGNNRFGDHGIELLAKWLRTRPNIMGLNVSANGIKDTGCRALSQHLPFSKVRLLDLARNDIGDAGLTHLLYSIKKPYPMRALFLWGNKIGESTLKIMSRMFESGVLDKENLDVRIYEVDGVLHVAFVPEDHYKHRYYCVMDHGCATPLKIKRNIVESKIPRNLTDFKFYKRIEAESKKKDS